MCQNTQHILMQKALVCLEFVPPGPIGYKGSMPKAKRGPNKPMNISCRRASKTPYHNPSICVLEKYSLHHPESIPHSWENSDSTAVAICAQQLSMHYRPWLECQDVNKLEMQETNGIYLFIPRCWTLIFKLQPFKPPPNALRPFCLLQ